MSNHNRLSPSGASWWVNCPGGPNLVATLPEKEDKGNAAANEGSLAHALGENCLVTGEVPSFWLDSKGAELATTDEESEMFKPFTIDQEMVTSIEGYIAYIQGLMGEDKDSILIVEEKVPLFYTEGTGTADVITYQPNEKRLIVVDLKYGKGVKVSAVDNLQLIVYGISAWLDHSEIDNIETVETHIYQPRMDNISNASYHVDELVKWVPKIEEAAKATEDPNAPCVAGETQCRWCDARPVCRAAMDDSLKHFEDISDLKPLDTITQEEQRLILDNQKNLTSYMKAIAEYAEESLQAGREFPGYKLVEGRSLRVWRNSEDAEKLLRGNFKKGEVLIEKLVSPAQADKLLANSTTRLQNKVDALITKPRGKPTLAPISDKRPAIEPDFVNLDETNQ